MLLMRSLTQRRAGKVVDSSIRYADVNPVGTPGMGPMPQWLQTSLKKSTVSVENPSTGDLGIQAGVYGALMVLTYVNGTSTSSIAPYAGADVPGLILASSFGASLYFMTRKNVKLGNELSAIYSFVFNLFRMSFHSRSMSFLYFWHNFHAGSNCCPLLGYSLYGS